MRKFISGLLVSVMFVSAWFAVVSVLGDGVRAAEADPDWDSDQMFDSDQVFDTRVKVNGNIVLTIEQGVVLTCKKGISVTYGNSLTIRGEGTLIVPMTDNNSYNTGCAGIGGDPTNINAGTINIEGCTLNVHGGIKAAGIGGGQGRNYDEYKPGGKSGTITISGGNVTATGGHDAAGIGGSLYGDSEDITITGGTVVANGGSSSGIQGSNAAGIGGGYQGSARGTITIEGGNVEAYGIDKSAGIGGGSGGSAASIIITGGTVWAQAQIAAAGIGGGYSGAVDEVLITGGDVTAIGGGAYGTYFHGGAGIGGGDASTGDYSGYAGRIRILGGKVDATAGGEAAAIGGGYRGSFGEIYICSEVKATAEGGGAAIGSGKDAAADAVLASYLSFGENGGTVDTPLNVTVSGGVGAAPYSTAGGTIEVRISGSVSDDLISIDKYRGSSVSVIGPFVDRYSRHVFANKSYFNQGTGLADASALDDTTLVAANLHVEFRQLDRIYSRQEIYYNGYATEILAPEYQDAVEFLGWYTDDDTPVLWPFESGRITRDRVLNARWRYDYNIDFATDEGSGSMDTVLLRKTGTLTPYVLPEPGFEPDSGRAFIGWKIENTGDIFKPGETIQITRDTTIYAQWDNEYTVKFYPIGGSGEMSSVKVANNGKYVIPECAFEAPDPECEAFECWRIAGGGGELNPGDEITVTGNVHLFAKWTNNWAALQSAINAASAGEVITLDKDYKNNGDYGPLVIREGKDIVIDLNGHNIDRNLSQETEDGNVITVKSGAVLTIRNSGDASGSITGGFNKTTGGGILVEGTDAGNAGKLFFEGGNIQGNVAYLLSTDGRGAGVYIGPFAEFTMSGGKISSNRAEKDGGGVYLDKNAVLNMTGGEISGNTLAEQGAGVYVAENAVFNMTSGSIDHNIAKKFGGGVYVAAEGRFNITNGSITANRVNLSGGSGAGVYGQMKKDSYDREYFADIHISGSPVISGNLKTSDDYASNLSIQDPVKIDGPLTEDASIGLTWCEYIDTYYMDCEVISSGLKDNGTMDLFTCDMDDPFKMILNTDGEIILTWFDLNPVFQSNYGMGSNYDDYYTDLHVLYGEPYALPECMFSKDDYIFTGWMIETDDTLYQPGDIVSFTGNRAIKACWVINVRSVEFELTLPECATEVTTRWYYGVDQTNRPRINYRLSNGQDISTYNYWLAGESYDPNLDGTASIGQYLNGTLYGGNTAYAIFKLESYGAGSKPKSAFTDDTVFTLKNTDGVAIVSITFKEDQTEAYIILTVDLDHVNGDPYISDVHDPTCEVPGYHFEDRICTKCGALTRIKIEDDPALGHDYQPEEGSYIAATCTADGKEEDLKCTRCGMVITGDVIPALGHDYKEVEGSGIDPTCTEPGREADMKCSRCGDQTEGEAVPATGHDWKFDEFVWTVNSGGEYSASAKYICLNDGAHSNTKKASVSVSVTDPTCTAEGFTTYTATIQATDSLDGQMHSATKTADIEPMVPHAYGKVEVAWSSDYSEAVASHKCSVCGHVESETAATTSLVNIPSTCVSEGLATYVAKFNNASFGRKSVTADLPVDPDAHDWELTGFTWEGDPESGFTGAAAAFVCSNDDEHETTAQASVTEQTVINSCTEGGKTVYTASVTLNGKDYSDTREGKYTEPTEHVVVTDNAKAATCTEDGLTEGSHCSVCGEIIVAQEVVPAKGHTKVTDPAKAATCTEDGLTEGSHCSVCGEIIVAQEVVPAKGHTEVTNPAKDATCTEDGHTEGSHCSVCNEIIVAQDVVPAYGHSWNDATCTLPKTCSICGATEGEELGHSWDEGKVTKPATCNEDGVKTYTCTACGESKTEPIPATEHNWSNWIKYDDQKHLRMCLNDYGKVEMADHVWDAGKITTPVECTKNGIRTYTCADCGATRTEPVPSTGHQVVTDDAVDATCTKPGLTEGSHCSVCGEVMVAQQEIKAKGHVWDDGVITKDPTVEEEGEKLFTCTACNDTRTEVIPKLTPAPTDITPTAKPTVKPSVSPTTKPSVTPTAKPSAKPSATPTAKPSAKPSATPTAKPSAKPSATPTAKPSTKPTATPTVKPSSKPTATPTKKPTATPTKKPTLTPTTKPTATPVVSLKLDKTSADIVCGKTLALKATLTGSNSKITWRSSDSKVAAVDPSGKVTAKMSGSVTITASAAGKNAVCKVLVLYKDVTDKGDFWYQPTYYLTEAGVAKGYDNQTLFKPANDCTRAQMVTFLWRLQGEPSPKTTKNQFSDVKTTDYFYKAVLWASGKKITTGYKDGTFKPQTVCTRAQTVTFLWRMAGSPAPKTSKNVFKDVKSSDYFYKATLWASEKKIVAGYSDGTFKPQGKCLRRQMVTFLYKYDKFINGKG